MAPARWMVYEQTFVTVRVKMRSVTSDIVIERSFYWY